MTIARGRESKIAKRVGRCWSVNTTIHYKCQSIRSRGIALCARRNPSRRHAPLRESEKRLPQSDFGRISHFTGDEARLNRVAHDDPANFVGPLLVGEMTGSADRFHGRSVDFGGYDACVARWNGFVVLAYDQENPSVQAWEVPSQVGQVPARHHTQRAGDMARIVEKARVEIDAARPDLRPGALEQIDDGGLIGRPSKETRGEGIEKQQLRHRREQKAA